jgi:hypothetical protein
MVAVEGESLEKRCFDTQGAGLRRARHRQKARSGRMTANLEGSEQLVFHAPAKTERAGDLSLSNHENQSMPYARELRDPKAHTSGVRRGDLWAFMASQEYTSFSPDMFYEFILQYQIPIIEKFGLAAYGCCEDLTEKICHQRKIPNLRRIAVSPFANARKCAEQIGGDYILSWRPNPATMISTGLDEDFVRTHMRGHFAIFRECGNPFDITLKNVETINRQPQNVAKWVRIVREEIDRFF